MAGGSPVSIEIARETVTGKDADSEQLREGARRILCALPRDAKVYGFKLDESRRPLEERLAKAAPELILEAHTAGCPETTGRMLQVVAGACFGRCAAVPDLLLPWAA